MKKAIDLLTEFLDHETSYWDDFDYDYGLEEKYQDYFEFKVTLRRRDTQCYCTMRIYTKAKILMIDMGEDNYVKIDHYSSNVRWFWIKNYLIWKN